MRLTIPNDSHKSPEKLLATKRVQREIQERASRIHALNVTLAHAFWREGWHGGFW